MVKLRFALYLNILFTVFLSQSVFSAQKADVQYYEQDDITNQIPYFDNRFHLDAKLEEITLLFYRRSGTPPIILVRPDGSKLKINNLPEDKVEWYDDKTFDMITIKKPMPGPWQAIGDILPKSKIMVVSDVTLKVDPLPEVILSGETLKVNGQIYNANERVNDVLFDDVVELQVDFFSTNNTGFDNFGAEPVEMGSFRDDGYELDEYAQDGIFTAEFELNFSPGEWVPIYKVIMPMITRELRQKPIILQPNPINLSVETTVEPLEFHKVTIAIDERFVDVDSLIFQGKVTFPDRQTEPFAIMEGKGKSRLKEIGYTESGIHRISLNAFGKTINDREFRLVVPDFTFNVERKNGLLVPSMDDDQIAPENSGKSVEQLIAEKLEEEKAQLALEIEQAKAEQEAIAKAKETKTLIIIGVSNGVIILIAIIAFVIIRKRKRDKDLFF